MNSTRTLVEASKQGYVVLRSSYRVSNEFYYYCERTDDPFVRVQLKTKYTIVSVDLIANSYVMGEPAWREINALLRAHHVGNWSPHYAGINFTYMYSPRIPVENAEHVAQTILGILAKPGYREPKQRFSTPIVEALDTALRMGRLERETAHVCA